MSNYIFHEIISHSFVCLLNSRILQFYATNNSSLVMVLPKLPIYFAEFL